MYVPSFLRTCCNVLYTCPIPLDEYLFFTYTAHSSRKEWRELDGSPHNKSTRRVSTRVFSLCPRSTYPLRHQAARWAHCSRLWTNHQCREDTDHHSGYWNSTYRSSLHTELLRQIC